MEVTEKHRIFAPTVPTTLPTCTADQGGAFAFYIDMKYTKLPLDYPEIISLLKERGLIIEDDNKAKNYLKVISYFRLANYFHPMERDKTLHLFKPDSYFENAVDLYEFDSELRSLTFSAIQAVEIALRTKMIHHISLKYGAFWFMDKNLFSNEAIFQKCQSHIQEELKRTKEEFILEHYKKYSDPDMPPVWKTLEVITFGTLSKLYCNIKDNSIKKKIAKEFYLPQHIILENWIKCAVVLRNYLAHHARLWNRNFPIIPQTSKPFRKKWLNHQIPVTNKLYPHLCCLQYFLNSIKEDNFFKERLKVLIANHPNVDIAALGFPADWEKEPLWEGRANGLVLLSPL